MAMKIYVRPINIGSVDQEQYEIEVQKTQSLKEVYQAFQAYLSDQLNCNEDEYDFDIERIAILQESRPKYKLPATAIIKQIVLDGKSDKFTFIFPRDGLPIVQIYDGEKYYYIDDYGKNELLYFIIKKKQDIKSIIQNEDYEYIKINGSMIDYKAEKDKPFKGFLENRMNTMVNVSIKLKEKKGQEKKEERKEEIEDQHGQQAGKTEVIKKEQIKKEKKDDKQKEERVKIEPQKNEQKRQPKKQQRQPIKQEEKLQQPQPIVPIQAQLAPANLSRQEPNKDLLKLVIKFESTISNKKQEFQLPVDPAKTMLQLLPQIIQQLRSRGFHWQQPGFESSRGDKDKLSIIYAGSQFKKWERQLRSFVNFPQQSKMIFTFERHYDGGA